MDREAWWATVHRVTKSRTRLSDFTFTINRNTSESVLVRWMNLEPIILNEVSQKEKDKYCILTYIYGIEKDGPDDPICRAAKEMQT